MSPTLRAGSLFEHIRHICERPRMFAPDFTLDHFHLYIVGYEDALGDAGLPSQYHRFREWIYARHPKWRDSPLWWALHVLAANKGDMERTLDEIIRLLDQFLATEGAEFVHFSDRHTKND
jgi:hypothetical protein